MLVCGNESVKNVGSEILEGIGCPTQGGRGAPLKHQHPKDVPQAVIFNAGMIKRD